MENQGIITGIGDKELGKNLIKPEYDAIINGFIIGKNTILEGLELNGNILSAGTCILCGYRGIIEKNEELDGKPYIYGEFTLNSIYGGSGEDSFKIVTTDSRKTTDEDLEKITSKGVYYLLLYIVNDNEITYKLDHYNDNGEWKPNGNYPLNAEYSVETQKVLDKAIIAPTATTLTELTTNEKGETVIVTDLHNSQPNRVANTEYVHAQIEREIDYGILTMNLVAKYKGLDIFENIGTITIRRKATYCIGNIALDLSKVSVAMLDSSLYTFYGDKDLTDFLPDNDTVFTMILSATAITSGRRICIMGTENGKIKEQWSIEDNGNGWAETSFGYQCNKGE